jgi:SAM-dependent methyltransferase
MLAIQIGIETINVVVRTFVEVFNPAGPVLDIGAYYPEGYAALCDRRPMFPGRTYVGCDIRYGPGVDRIEDAEHLTFPDRSVGSVLILETLEHIPHPQRVVAEAKRVLTDDGMMLVSVPFNYRLHGFPTDYWRFTASGLYTLLAEFPRKTVFAIGPHLMPSTVFAVVATHREQFEQGEQRLHTALREAFRQHKRRHTLKVLEERSRDLLGLLLGRARVGIAFYNPSQQGGYRQ